VYRSAAGAGIYKTPSIRVAETAKVILSEQLHELGIDTADVLAAVRAKWNFFPFTRTDSAAAASASNARKRHAAALAVCFATVFDLKAFVRVQKRVIQNSKALPAVPRRLHNRRLIVMKHFSALALSRDPVMTCARRDS
jgi:hypothetical protein